MEEKKDIRWIQRLDHYERAVARLGAAADIIGRSMHYGEDVDLLIKEGLIQRFEYTQELAWKVMKDYAEYQGFSGFTGSRDVMRKALEIGIISDRDWMKTIVDRNVTSHCYDEDEFIAVLDKIVNTYIPLFEEFKNVMIKKRDEVWSITD